MDEHSLLHHLLRAGHIRMQSAGGGMGLASAGPLHQHDKCRHCQLGHQRALGHLSAIDPGVLHMATVLAIEAPSWTSRDFRVWRIVSMAPLWSKRTDALPAHAPFL